MMRSLWTAASGMTAQQTKIDTISNNLANVNTTGFKKSRVDFQDLLYQTVKYAGTPSTAGPRFPPEFRLVTASAPVATQRIFSQGMYQQTDNPLDVVIEGDGFFQVLLPDGSVAYTRDGAFKLDADGRITTSDGFPIEPEIVVPSESLELSIASDGTVTIMQPGDSEPERIGEIQIVRFVNPAGLKSEGRNLYSAPLPAAKQCLALPVWTASAC
jgi:flagellar basal-body rod protein FlgG